MGKTVAFIGTYTEDILFGTGEVLHGHGDGVYVYTLENERLEQREIACTPNASYLVLDTAHGHLFTTNERKETDGHPGGSVSAFAFDKNVLKLHYLNTQRVDGADPCHVEVDAAGRHLLCANFMSGSVSVLPIENNGCLGKMCCFIQHEGTSIDTKRQRGPHAHGVFFTPENKRVFVPDLGMDRVVCYNIDEQTGRLAHCAQLDIPAPLRGTGPRHMAFHSSGKYMYMNTEMGSTVHTYKYDEATGKTELIQTLTTIPKGISHDETSTAAIKIHPNGKLLYVSNRGHDSLAIYSIDEETGLLTLLDIQPTEGRIPRDFDISPDGSYVLVAHQSGDDAVLFKIDLENGALSEIQRIKVPTPICVKFYEV